MYRYAQKNSGYSNDPHSNWASFQTKHNFLEFTIYKLLDKAQIQEIKT